MKIAIIVFICLMVAVVVAYWVFFSRNNFYTFSSKPGGGSVTFSRRGVSFESAPDHYAMNGLDHLESYVSQLLVPTNGFKFLHIFTPDGKRGFGLSAREGKVEAGLMVEWRQEVQK